MRCKSCDNPLSDTEASRKADGIMYEEMCSSCLRQVILADLYEQDDDVLDILSQFGESDAKPNPTE